MKWIVIAMLLSTLSMAMVSCGGGYTTGTLQKSDQSFLKFTGHTQGITISIDEAEPFSYSPRTDLYQLKPGKHLIQIYRNNSLVVNREILLDNQTTFEIEVP